MTPRPQRRIDCRIVLKRQVFGSAHGKTPPLPVSTLHGVVFQLCSDGPAAPMKKPGLANEAGLHRLTTCLNDQPRVRERIMKLS
jgi:hypothetical protein